MKLEIVNEFTKLQRIWWNAAYESWKLLVTELSAPYLNRTINCLCYLGYFNT